MDIEYKCSPFTNSSGFTPLMHKVMNSRKVPLNIYYIEDIDKQNTKGWTALMLACRNSNTDSTIETVKLLLEKEQI